MRLNLQKKKDFNNMEKQREKITFTKDQARNIAYNDNPNFEEVLTELSDQTRWSTVKRIVVKRVADGKFFESYYSVGSTECQEQRAYEYDEPVFIEVFAEKVEVIKYI